MNKRTKKIKKVSNNENSNETVVKKTKQSNSKTNRLKKISNSFDIKKKDAIEKKFDSKKGKNINGTDTSSMTCSSNTEMESGCYEEEQSTEELIVENSSNLPDTDNKEAIRNKRAKLEVVPNFNCSVLLKKWNQDTKIIHNIKIKTVEPEMKQNTEKDVIENKIHSKKRKTINKSDTSSMCSSNTEMESVGYEEEQDTGELIIVENSSNLPDTDNQEAICNKRAKLEIVPNLNCSVLLKKWNQDTKKIQNTKIKTVEPEMKQSTETTTEKYVIENKIHSKKSKNINKKDRSSMCSSNTEMESVGYEEEQGTEELIIVENSSNLPDTDKKEAKRNKRAKLEIVPNMNCLVLLKPEMKQSTETTTEKDVIENKIHSKKRKNINKLDTSSMCSSNTEMESVGYEEEQGTEELIIVENSSNLPDTDKKEATRNKRAFLKWRRKSRMFNSNENQSKTKTIVNLKVISEKDVIENKFDLKKSKKINKTDTSSMCSTNTKIESVKEEQFTEEIIVENSSNLPVTDDNEAIRIERAKLEMECSSNCQYKRKLYEFEDIIQDYLKRFKPS